jgi:hypothetical protein
MSKTHLKDEELICLSKFSGYTKPQVKTIVDAFMKGIETDSAFNTENLDKKGQQLVAEAKADIEAFDMYYSHVLKSQNVSLAGRRENECKSDFRALMSCVRSRGKNRVAGFKEAAERISLEAKANGLQYADFGGRTDFATNVSHFVGKLHGKLAADVRLLGVETDVAALQTSSDNLHDILAEIDHAKGLDKERPKYKVVKDNVIGSLYKIAMYVNYDYFMNGTSKFENFASDINATVERVEHSRTMSKAMAEVQKAKEEMKKNGAATETPDAKKDKAHGKHSGSSNTNGSSASGTNSNGGASASGVNGSSANGSGTSSANGTSSGTNGSSASGTSGTSSNGDVTELHPADEQPSGSGSGSLPSNGGTNNPADDTPNGGNTQQPSDNGTQQPGSGSGDGGLSPAM